MVAVNISPYKTDANGNEIVSCTIVADTVPDTLPTTGAGIENLDSHNKFAPMSILYVVGTGAVYVADESGEFVAQ